MRLLVVEDATEIAEALLAHFGHGGHAADWAPDLDTARAFLAGSTYDAVILDAMLPDGDGRDLIREAPTPAPPFLMLTARSKVADRVAALDLGADDYLTKPFDFAELDARLRAVLRRRPEIARPRKRVGRLEVDPLGGGAFVDGAPVELRNRELRLLEILASRPGRAYSKAELMDRLFALDETPNENAIEVYVGRLRKRIAPAGVRIETVRGVGYRLAEEDG